MIYVGQAMNPIKRFIGHVVEFKDDYLHKTMRKTVPEHWVLLPLVQVPGGPFRDQKAFKADREARPPAARPRAALDSPRACPVSPMPAPHAPPTRTFHYLQSSPKITNHLCFSS